MSIETRVPRPGSEAIATCPPSDCTRSASSAGPCARRRVARRGRPRSCRARRRRSRASCRCRWHSARSRPRSPRRGGRRCGAPPAWPGRRSPRCRGRAGLDARVDLHRHAARPERLRRARRGRRRCPRRGDPAGRGRRAASGARACSRARRWRRVAACVAARCPRGSGPRSRRARTRCPARSCSGPSCSSLAIRRRSSALGLVGAAGQHLAALLLEADPAREPVAERQLGDRQGRQRDQEDGDERAPDAVRRGVDAARCLVGLDQDPLAAVEAEWEVDLHQAALAALEVVLRQRQVAARP